MKIKDFIKLNKLSISSVMVGIIAIILIVAALIISIETPPIAYVTSGFIIGTNFCTICYNVVELVMNWRNSK